MGGTLWIDTSCWERGHRIRVTLVVFVSLLICLQQCCSEVFSFFDGDGSQRLQGCRNPSRQLALLKVSHTQVCRRYYYACCRLSPAQPLLFKGVNTFLIEVAPSAEDARR
jgi:hypothetical protein